MATVRHDVFLCHTGADKDWTRSLGEQLEQRLIGTRQIKVWFDEWDIDYGRSIISEIDTGLRESSYVGLVLSPAMVRADWPTAEWQSQIMDDPIGKRGRILPLLLHRFDEMGAPIELPFVLKPIKRFDFTTPSRFGQEFERLIRRISNLPPLRGTRRTSAGSLGHRVDANPEPGQEAPDAIEESLTSNLLPVTDSPEFLYSADTAVERKREIWDKVRGKIAPFFLHSKKLFSFDTPGDKKSPFYGFVNPATSRPEPTATFMRDPDLSRKIVGLFNEGLRNHCRGLDIWTAKGDRELFYPPIFGDAPPRTFSWGKGKPRTIAVMKKSLRVPTEEGSADPGTTRAATESLESFGVHMAARMRFLTLGGRVYLLVDPAWMFTVDGIKAVEGRDMGVFSTKWGGRERNAALLRNVLMWGLLLSRGARSIEITLDGKKSGSRVTLQAVPAHTRINVGLFGDSIRLDRILSGEGAGEVGASDAEADSSELDTVANMALLDSPPPSAESSEREPTNDDPDGDEEALPF